MNPHVLLPSCLTYWDEVQVLNLLLTTFSKFPGHSEVRIFATSWQHQPLILWMTLQLQALLVTRNASQLQIATEIQWTEKSSHKVYALNFLFKTGKEKWHFEPCSIFMSICEHEFETSSSMVNASVLTRFINGGSENLVLSWSHLPFSTSHMTSSNDFPFIASCNSTLGKKIILMKNSEIL